MSKSNTSLNSRIASIQRATGRKHADATTLWNKIKDIPVDVAVASQNNNGGNDGNGDVFNLTFTRNECKYHLKFNSFNTVNYEDVRYCNLFLVNTALELSRRNIHVNHFDNSVDGILAAEKDYFDRKRILALDSLCRFAPAFYFVSSINDNSIKGRKKVLEVMSNHMNHLRDYSQVGIYMVFDGIEEHTRSFFTDNVMKGLMGDRNGGSATIFNLIDQEIIMTLYFSHVEKESASYPVMEDPIPHYAPFRSMEKPSSIERLALGLGAFGDQVNLGDPWQTKGMKNMSHAMIAGDYLGRRDFVQMLVSQASDLTDPSNVRTLHLGDEKVFSERENVPYFEGLDSVLGELRRIHDIIYQRVQLSERDDMTAKEFDSHFPWILVFIDDLYFLSNMKKKGFGLTKDQAEEALAIIAQIVRIGRSLKVQLFLSTSILAQDTFDWAIIWNTALKMLVRDSLGAVDNNVFFGRKTSNSHQARGRVRMNMHGKKVVEFQSFDQSAVLND